MTKQEQLINELEEYKNYLYALQCYEKYGNEYGDKEYIDMYEEKQKQKEMIKNGR